MRNLRGENQSTEPSDPLGKEVLPERPKDQLNEGRF